MTNREVSRLRTPRRNQQAVINFACGALLFVSPWVLGYSSDLTATITASICGAAVGILAIAELVSFTDWMEWLSVVFAAALVLAPWALQFSSFTRAMAAQVVFGAIVLASSIWEIWTSDDTQATAH